MASDTPASSVTPVVRINGRQVGSGHPTYVVAEMSANHGRQFDRAVQIIRAAKTAGADAIKVQTFTAETHTLRSSQRWFRVGGDNPWTGRHLYELYEEASMPWEWQPRLRDIALDCGLDFFSACVDTTSADFLEGIGVPVHKLASFELVDLDLIERLARTGKPLILSTGMATLDEIEEAVQTARAAGAVDLMLLKCTSTYPAHPPDMHLRTIPQLARTFNVPVGLSDHSPESAVAVAAVALGACLVEKHLTISRSVPTPDAAFSLEPDEFRAMVDAVRVAEAALGDVRYGPTPAEAGMRRFRRSLFVVRDVEKGQVLSRENIRSIRPADGLHPRHLHDVLGRCATRAVASGTPLGWDMIDRKSART
jgi:pseudaminic acid synthase